MDNDNSTGRKVGYEVKRLPPSYPKTILRKSMRKKDDPTNNPKKTPNLLIGGSSLIEVQRVRIRPECSDSSTAMIE